MFTHLKGKPENWSLQIEDFFKGKIAKQGYTESEVGHAPQKDFVTSVIEI